MSSSSTSRPRRTQRHATRTRLVPALAALGVTALGLAAGPAAAAAPAGGASGGEKLPVSRAEVTQEPAAAAATSSTAKVLVVLAYWTAPDSVTQASAQAEIGNDDAWFDEVSYGQQRLTATATPWVRIAGPAANGGCGGGPAAEDAIVAQARAAAKVAGYDSAQYDRTMVYFPYDSSCPWRGLGGFSDNWVLLNGAMSNGLTTHEQGHNLGLLHANTYTCFDAAGNPISMANYCDAEQQGDRFTSMGRGGSVHYNGMEKDKLGWLGNRKVELASGSTVTLAPLEQQAAAPQVAVVTANQFRRYYIEYRQLIGMDAYLGWDGTTTHGTDGVLIHVDDSNNTGWQGNSLLLDMSPDGNFREATLKSGQSWTTPEGLTLAVGAADANGATVSLSGGVTPLPTVSVAGANVTEGASGTAATASFPVHLSAASSSPVTVDYATADGTARAPGDYATASGTVTFAPGETDKTVPVIIAGDALDEADETFTLDLRGPSGATLGTSSATSTITDDDATPSLRISDVTVTEGAAGTSKPATFNVTLSAPSGRSVTVTRATANGTAVAPSDYKAQAAGAISIPAGASSVKVPVTVLGDAVREPNETFAVKLSSPLNAVIADGSGIGTISNDD